MHAGQGLTVLADAAKLNIAGGASIGRASLAQAMHSLADQIPTVQIEPGFAAVTPDGAVFGAPPRLAIGEPGSGGHTLHSIAERVDAPRVEAAVPPVASHVDVHPTSPTPGSYVAAPAGGAHSVTPDAATPDGARPSGSPSDGAIPDGASADGTANDAVGSVGPPADPVVMADGTLYTPELSDAGISAAGYSSFYESLPAVLDKAGVSMQEFRHLVESPVASLTRHEMSQLIDIRDSLPSPDNTGHLQKTIPFEQAEAIIEGKQPPLQGLQGFVARPVDTLGMTTQQLHDALGLNYPGSKYTSDLAARRPYFDVRFETPSGVHPSVPDSAIRWLHDAVPDNIVNITDTTARTTAIKVFWDGLPGPQKDIFEARYPSIGFDLPKALSLDTENPFRGSGFSGTGSGFVPEGTFGQTRIDIPNGAELWRTLPDGTREIVGVFGRSDPSAPGTWLLVDVTRSGAVAVVR
ncbi:hypothetical protein [Cryobacterium serini]|uniref:Uncharacterized protein n=1 Tax=Cryobacterium serini TaxID=1259201 RepID=A0A4R9BM88_9MICO|nr:hypothetical protein [Cryobacterium serini]TFD86083.1 hypothetical protein E3T51_13160 [Cryobacterium serini]